MFTRAITRWTGPAAFTAVALAAMLVLCTGAAHAARMGGGGGGRGGGGGGHVTTGGGAHSGGGAAYRGGGGGYARGGGGGGYAYRGGGGYAYRGGPYYRGYRPWRGYHPRSVFRVGIGFGYPAYYYDDYPYYYAPYPVVADPPVVRERIAVSQEPPSGCYYWDPFCERRFSRLDVYDEHLRDHDHDRILEVLENDTGSRVGVFEYTKDHWVSRY